MAAALALAGASWGAPAAAQGPVTVSASMDVSRATVPVEIDGQRVACVLDTGASTILVSQEIASAAHLAPGAGVTEIAPDGREYGDRTTTIAHLQVARLGADHLRALISSRLTGERALCGYDFFERFPALIDRDAVSVTFFPSAQTLHRLHCQTVDLTPHVPVGNVYINGSEIERVVFDSGMAGGGALWDGVLPQLAPPLALDAQYTSTQDAIAAGLACGHTGSAAFLAGAHADSVALCTSTHHPDGYNGIIETNLASVHRLAIDYPHRRICFGIGTPRGDAAGSPSLAVNRNAWSRFHAERPLPPRHFHE